MTAPTPDPSKWLTDLLAGQQDLWRILGGGADPAASPEAVPPPALPFMSPWVVLDSQLFPQAQWILATSYFGWMAAFGMVLS